MHGVSVVMPSLLLCACRYKSALEALYTQHEERQRERVRAIRAQGGQSNTAERVKHVRNHSRACQVHCNMLFISALSF